MVVNIPRTIPLNNVIKYLRIFEINNENIFDSKIILLSFITRGLVFIHKFFLLKILTILIELSGLIVTTTYWTLVQFHCLPLFSN